jgi:hypothetical protein
VSEWLSGGREDGCNIDSSAWFLGLRQDRYSQGSTESADAESPRVATFAVEQMTRPEDGLRFAVWTDSLFAGWNFWSRKDLKRVKVGLLNERRFNFGVCESMSAIRARHNPAWHCSLSIPTSNRCFTSGKGRQAVVVRSEQKTTG